MTSSPLWLGGESLILASASPIRRSLLEAAGIPVTVSPSAVDERALEHTAGALAPADLALHLAEAKARAVAAAGRLTLGADQTLSVEGALVHKAPTEREAIARLARLSGRTHHLHSAAVLLRGDQPVWRGVETVAVTLRDLSADLLARYAAAMGARLCATVGGYGAEGLGRHLIARIEGDHAAVLGLPMGSLLDGLRAAGLVPR